jgi:hypothetical protein
MNICVSSRIVRGVGCKTNLLRRQQTFHICPSLAGLSCSSAGLSCSWAPKFFEGAIVLEIVLLILY